MTGAVDKNDPAWLTGAVAELVGRRASELARSVIKAFRHSKAVPKMTGDDERYADAWEEFVAQVVDDQGPFFYAYEQTLQAFCAAEVERLSHMELWLLWLHSDSFTEWDEAEPLSGDQHQDVAGMIYQRVWRYAANEEAGHDL